jgi:TonB family protein
LRTELLLAASVAVHGLFALGVSRVAVPRPAPPPVTITMVKVPSKARAAPRPPPPPSAAEPVADHASSGKSSGKPTTPNATRGRAAPRQSGPRDTAPATGPSPGADGALDFGLSLGGDGSGTGTGVGGPASGGGDEPRAVAAPLRARQDDCAEAIVKPTVLQLPQPPYPRGATEGVEGKVRVEIQVDERGAVLSARTLSSLGSAFDEAALRAARAASFRPATRCQQPVKGTFVVGFRFAPS